MFGRNDRKHRRRIDQVSQFATVISNRLTMEGHLKTTDDIRISGTIKGNIEAKGLLLLAEQGTITGDIKAETAILRGAIVGDVFASDHIDLGENSRIEGNLKAASVSIEEGAYFRGEVSMNTGDTRQPDIKMYRDSRKDKKN